MAIIKQEQPFARPRCIHGEVCDCSYQSHLFTYACVRAHTHRGSGVDDLAAGAAIAIQGVCVRRSVHGLSACIRGAVAHGDVGPIDPRRDGAAGQDIETGVVTAEAEGGRNTDHRMARAPQCTLRWCRGRAERIGRLRPQPSPTESRVDIGVLCLITHVIGCLNCQKKRLSEGPQFAEGVLEVL